MVASGMLCPEVCREGKERQVDQAFDKASGKVSLLPPT